jgi:hypothetical protein
MGGRLFGGHRRAQWPASIALGAGAPTIPGLSSPDLSARRVFEIWWPLALSWLLMGAEQPLFTACVARLELPAEPNLAAWASLVFPLSLVIEAPIIMLLAAATALARDRDSWRLIRRAMHLAGVGLTVLHVLVAFTPLFDVLAAPVLGVPEESLEPARLGLRVMTPWTWAIAYRRTHQGLLIRLKRARPVVVGTLLRLLGNAAVYLAGWLALRGGGAPSGMLVGAGAIAVGVSLEAVFVGWCARRALVATPLPVHSEGEPLSWGGFLRFYLPLAMTPLIALVVPPMGSAAMARMQAPVLSLATWPAVHGLVFFLRSAGFAFNEVVLSLLDQPGAARTLRRFGLQLAAVTSALLLLVAFTPLAGLWFGGLMGLAPDLRDLGRAVLPLAVLWPASQALQSWFQGLLVHHRRTREVTVSIAVAFGVSGLLLLGAVRWNPGPGLFLAVAALMTGNLAQTAWLAWRGRGLEREPAR